jgi:hypothetical protein
MNCRLQKSTVRLKRKQKGQGGHARVRKGGLQEFRGEAEPGVPEGGSTPGVQGEGGMDYVLMRWSNELFTRHGWSFLETTVALATISALASCWAKSRPHHLETRDILNN